MLNSNELVGGAKLLQSISFCFIKTLLQKQMKAWIRFWSGPDL